ncbi:MAG: alpha/beta fold hydrolase [Saprospiraceae bacterium]
MKVKNKIEYLATTTASAEKAVAPTFPIWFRLVRFAFRFLGPLFPKRAGRIAFQLFATPRTRARHKISDRVMEKARIFDILYGGHILKAYEWGEGDRVILLVHGWESRGTALRSFVPSLVKRGFRVVAFDGPAHGNSGGKQTTLPHFGGAICALINHLGGVDGIIAHSFGGASTAFALANLDTEIALRKLVLVGVPSRMTKVTEHYLELFKMPSSVAKEYRKILNEVLNMPIENADLKNAFPKMRVGETLIVHDEEDTVVPFASSQDIYDHWENATLLVSKGLGHYKLMKHPALVKRVTEFIDSY